MTDRRRKAVLVTGGAGFIGSHCCKALAAHGYLPVTLDNLSRGHRAAVQWGPLEVADVADADEVARIMVLHQVVAVIHLAGVGFVGESMSQPGMYYRENVAATIGLIRGLSLAGAQSQTQLVPLVFSSSCASYGAPVGAELPFSEDHPQNPVSTYGFSKLVVERMLLDHARADGLQVICLRYFNAAGSDPDLEIGECHEPEFHLIPTLLRAADSGETFVVNGTDLSTADGSCVRDYVHVQDLAKAHIAACERLLGGSDREQFEAYNLGTGNGFSVFEIIDAVRRVTGCDVKVQHGPARAGDPASALALSERAQADLQWDPINSDLATMISSSWAWYKLRQQSPWPNNQEMAK